MRKIFVLFLFLITHIAYADSDDVGEAIAVTSSVFLNPYINETVLDVGPGLAIMDGNISPQWNASTSWTIKNRVRLGAGLVFIPSLPDDTAASDVYAGFSFGMKDSTALLGPYYIDLLFGGGIHSAFVVEPRATFLLHRFFATRMLQIKQNFGIYSRIGLRYSVSTRDDEENYAAMFSLLFAFIASK